MISAYYAKAPDYDTHIYGLSEIEQSITRLIKQADYLADEAKQRLVNCCFFAARAHDGQKRRSGEPYICHPIKVAEILAKEVRFDLPVLQAAVLHDVIEDTSTSKTEMIAVFGDEVANLVDGVSKLEKDAHLSPQELQAQTFKKLVHAMEADPRVVMIKFADRMHNMQTLGALRMEKRRRIAHETLEVYVPIASRLGMFIFKTELEELAFKHLHPWRYEVVKHLLNDNAVRSQAIETVTQYLNAVFKQHNITASVRKRRRNLYNIYQKLQRTRLKRRQLENASIPFIILTNSEEDCYRALWLIHQHYTPVLGKLRDYIASAKVNGYQSIHTSVLTEARRVVNFQIRTKRMHAVAESGIIAIWRQHNESQNISELATLPPDKPMRRWLKNIRTTSDLASSPLEFYDAVKRDLSGSEIQVLSPKGESFALPEKASVIDFAYYIHTDIGNHLDKAEVNGVDVSLDFTLSNGQTVELFTDKSANPRGSWLKSVKTARARTAIRHYLRSLDQEELAEIGYYEIEQYLRKREIRYRFLKKMLTHIAEVQYQISLIQLLHKIALHDVKRRHILNELQKIAYQEGLLSTIAVRVYNHPGVLATVSDTIGRYDANILRLHFPDDMQAEEVTMIFEIHVESLAQLKQIIDLLRQHHSVKFVKHEETIQ